MCVYQALYKSLLGVAKLSSLDSYPNQLNQIEPKLSYMDLLSVCTLCITCCRVILIQFKIPNIDDWKKNCLS